MTFNIVLRSEDGTYCMFNKQLVGDHVILTFSSFVRWYVTMVVRQEKRGAG